jgi:hypothetical protein
MDVERTRRAAEVLYAAFAKEGIFGKKWMPEDVLPDGVASGSLEHALFITLTVAIDYQREAVALWDAARRTFADPATRYLFEPKALHETPRSKAQVDLQRYKLSKKPVQDCHIWRTVGITFFKKWEGDPRKFLADCQWDAPTILERLQSGRHVQNGREVLDYPYLRGNKIGPLWVRMLRDNVGLEIKNWEAVPIAVDVHVARATFSLGLVRGGYDGVAEEIYQEIRRVWREGVRGLRVAAREMVALDVDGAMWRLSKYGCTDRDLVTGKCPNYDRCPARELCVPGKVVVSNGRVELDT